jgi:predicted transcriptional regulator
LKIKFQVAILAFILLLANGAKAVETGCAAPPFRVISGDDQVMTLDALKGKVVILFYETRDTAEKNRTVKEVLKSKYRALDPSLQAAVISVPVVNCSSAGLFKGMWKKGIRDASKREGMSVYGDWDGRMRVEYGFADRESNFMILDKDGTVRCKKSGLISDTELQDIIKLLDQLIGSQGG